MRLFIAINLPEEIKDILTSYQSDLPYVRWTKRDNLHITVKFLGDKEEEIERVEPFEVTINSISLWPSGDEARYIWAHTDNGHITLGRVNRMMYRQIEPEERFQPVEINKKFKVNSLELMSSNFRHYKIIKSVKL